MGHEHKETTNPGSQSAAGSGPQVFYDGACPLCRAEIGLYRKSGAQAEFCDVSNRTGPLPSGHSRDELLARFHVRRADGRMVSGAAAFAELWKATPGWRWLGHIIALPPFVWIAQVVYRLFLVVRPALQHLARLGSAKT